MKFLKFSFNNTVGGNRGNHNIRVGGQLITKWKNSSIY